MSYDVYITIDTGGESRATVAEAGNYTSNLGYFFAWAFSDLPLGEDVKGAISERYSEWTLGALDELPVEAALEKLDHALRRIETARKEHPERLEQFKPSNDWGNVTSATLYLEKIRDMARRHPKAFVEVSY